MSSSGTRSPLVAIPENVGEQEESHDEQNVSVISIDLMNFSGFVNFAVTVEALIKSCFSFQENEEAASAVNPLSSSDAAQILPMLQNLLLNNNIQRV